MSDPTILYCVGATKAGTSWFYRTLHDNPECHLRAVKEVHYWDSFDETERAFQLDLLAKRRAEYAESKAQALATGLGWKARNMDRRLTDGAALETMLAADRTGDRAYVSWLTDGFGDARLVADITPAYASLPEDTLARMAAASPRTLFVYLIRDPVARLWSHVRMQAARNLPAGRDLADKANNILWRILMKGQEAHVTDRGDYPGTVAKLRRVVPDGRLRVDYTERLFTVAGQADMAAFLGLTALNGNADKPEHEGPKATMRPDLMAPAIAYLKDHYRWAADTVGPLPDAWHASVTKEAA